MNEESLIPSVKMCNRRSLNSMQQKVQTTILGKDELKISKVLSLRACAVINNIETFDGGLKYSLDVMYEAVVCLETGEITCVEQSSIDNNATLENSLISAQSTVCVNACVVDNDTSIVDGEVVVKSLVNVDFVLKGNDCTFVPPTIDENISVKSTENLVCSQKDTISASGNVKGEISVDGKFKRVIFSSYTGYVKGINVKTDYFVLNGEMLVTLLCEYEDGQLKTISKAFEFNEEIEQKGIGEDDILQVDFRTAFRPEVNIVIGSNGETLIDIGMPYTVQGEVYTCYNQEVIVDAYDTKREVNLTTESFENSICKPAYFAEEKIIATFNLSEDSPRVERILGTSGENISLVNTIVRDGELTLEGIANVCTIYYSEDEEGNKVLNSVLIDLPYSLAISNKELKEGNVATISIKLGEISVKNKKGRELEVVANVYVCYNVSTPTVSAFTTSVAFGDEKPTPEYSLEIVVCKQDETLWDVAKRLSVKEELLLAQNPDVILPLKEGDKLVVFREVANN